ncbi:MAG: alpha/beta fold hydrolase [Planctomycetes bacterium]|nr:alpha/beta fold hydrolase [Planctomycetota bacterium]
MRRIALLLVVLACQACMFLRSTTVPMPAVLHPATSGTADTLVVLLPGFGDGPQDYYDNGVVTKIREVNPRADVIAVDAHFGYYKDRTMIDRLHEDVIGPLAGRYQHVWLVGISMGGFGAVIYTQAHRELVEGMILMAPYMGSRDVITEVDVAGGLDKWTPPDPSTIADDETRKYYEAWIFLQGYAKRPETMPRLFLGHGADDSLHQPNGFVGRFLPEGRYLVRAGGHKWTVWRPMFAEFAGPALGAK